MFRHCLGGEWVGVAGGGEDAQLFDFTFTEYCNISDFLSSFRKLNAMQKNITTIFSSLRIRQILLQIKHTNRDVSFDITVM